MTSESTAARDEWTSGVRWATASQIGRQAAALAGVVILSRFVEPSQFGVMAMVVVVTGFVLVIRDLGLSPAIVQAAVLSDELASTAFWLSTAAGIGLSLLLVIAAPWIALVFSEPDVEPVLRVTTIAIAVGSLNAIHQARLERTFRFRGLAIVDLVSQTMALVVAAVLAVLGGGVWSLVSQVVVATCVFTVGIWWIDAWRPAIQFSSAVARDAWAYSRGFSAFSVLNYFARNMDNAIVGVNAGSMELGFYSVAYRIMLLPLLAIVTVANRVQFPLLAAARDDRTRSRLVFRRALLLVTIAAVPSAVLLAATADRLVRVALGPDWAPTADMLRWLAIAGSLQCVVALVGPIYLAVGRTGRLAGWGLLSTSVVIIAFVVGVQWGALGVAIAYAIASILLTYPALAFALPLIGLRPIAVLKYAAPVVALALVAGLVTWTVGLLLGGPVPDLVVLVVQGVSGALTFLVLMWALRRPDLVDAAGLIGLDLKVLGVHA